MLFLAPQKDCFVVLSSASAVMIRVAPWWPADNVTKV